MLDNERWISHPKFADSISWVFVPKTLNTTTAHNLPSARIDTEFVEGVLVKGIYLFKKYWIEIVNLEHIEIKEGFKKDGAGLENNFEEVENLRFMHEKGFDLYLSILIVYGMGLNFLLLKFENEVIWV